MTLNAKNVLQVAVIFYRIFRKLSQILWDGLRRRMMTPPRPFKKFLPTIRWHLPVTLFRYWHFQPMAHLDRNQGEPGGWIKSGSILKLATCTLHAADADVF
jgi:hypothetical protein